MAGIDARAAQHVAIPNSLPFMIRDGEREVDLVTGIDVIRQIRSVLKIESRSVSRLSDEGECPLVSTGRE